MMLCNERKQLLEDVLDLLAVNGFNSLQFELIRMKDNPAEGSLSLSALRDIKEMLSLLR